MLREGPLSADEVARRVTADPGATHRLMRALANNGVLTLRRDGRFGLTRMGHALRSDYDGSMAPMITMICSPEHWAHWGDLLHSVSTGQTAVKKLRGSGIFEYLGANPDYAAVFNAAMTAVSSLAIQAAVPIYDFTDRRLIVDVGGGHRAPPHPGMMLDLEMLVHTGGRERTAAEYSNLLSRAGFRQTRVVPTAGLAAIVEAVPV